LAGTGITAGRTFLRGRRGHTMYDMCDVSDDPATDIVATLDATARTATTLSADEFQAMLVDALPSLYRYAFRLTRNRADAEDLVQTRRCARSGRSRSSSRVRTSRRGSSEFSPEASGQVTDTTNVGRRPLISTTHQTSTSTHNRPSTGFSGRARIRPARSSTDSARNVSPRRLANCRRVWRRLHAMLCGGLCVSRDCGRARGTRGDRSVAASSWTENAAEVAMVSRSGGWDR
jgi:hypothetical protein